MIATNFRQMAYVTSEEMFDRTLTWWTQNLGVGPFYLKKAQFTSQTFRGKPSNIACEIALTYVGDTQLEIIRPTNDEPSPYREYLDAASTIPAAGIFHHVLIDTDDYEGTRSRLLKAGCEDGMNATVSFGRSTCYLDGTKVLGHYIELVEPTAFNKTLCALMRKKSREWDGQLALRNYDDLVEEARALGENRPQSCS